MGAKTGAAVKIRALATRYPDMSKAEIARRARCHPHNVSLVLAKFLGDTGEDALRDYQQNQADVLDSLSLKLLSSISPKKIANASAVQAITGAAILIDKARLVRGQATSLNVSVLMDVVEAMRNKASDVTTIEAKAIVDAKVVDDK